MFSHREHKEHRAISLPAERIGDRVFSGDLFRKDAVLFSPCSPWLWVRKIFGESVQRRMANHFISHGDTESTKKKISFMFLKLRVLRSLVTSLSCGFVGDILCHHIYKCVH